MPLKFNKTTRGALLAGSLLCLAAIIAVAALIYLKSSSGERVETTTTTTDAAQAAACAHGVNCVHGHEAYSDSDARKSIKRYPAVTLTRAVVASSIPVAQAKAGDRLKFDFGDGLVFNTQVKFNKTFPGKQQSVGMQLLGRKGSIYWLEKADGSIMGNIILKEADKNIIYRYSGREGDLVIRQVTQQEYICASGDTDESIGMPVSDAPFTPAGESAIIPLLNSLPGAQAVVYIDFDGEEVSGTRWNTLEGRPPTINAEPAGFDEDRIREVWEEVAEDMRPFKINVTTDRAVFDAAPQNKKMMCIVTPTSTAFPGTGGVAFLDSFYDGSIDPCWCFNLGRASAAQTVSHEIGHTFGLRHDGLTSQNDPEYHRGNGTWGPIMGAPFGLAVVTWSDGNYDGSTNTEDDLEIISSRSAPFRDDQYGDTAADAFDLAGDTGEEAVGIVGVVETPEDIDVFSFTTSGGSVTLSVEPEGVDVGNVGFVTNMNLRLQLYNEAGELMAEDDPENSYAASIDTELETGNYTLHVEGTNSGSPDVSGFSDYGSIGQYGLTGNVEGLGGLIVEIEQPQLEEVSIAEGNGLVLAASVVGGEDFVNWRAVGAPAGGTVGFSDPSSKSTRATFSVPGLYTLRFRATLDPIFTDREIKVSVERVREPKAYPNRGPVVTIEPAELYFSSQGLITGGVSDDGVPSTDQPAYEWKVISGTAEISNIRAQRPQIIFNDNQPSVISLESSDGQIRTFAQAQVQSFFERRMIVDRGASGRWFIPGNDDLGLDWTLPGFDDSAWNAGPSGFGYDPDNRYSFYIGNGTDLKASMKDKSPSAYIRIPFSLPQLDYIQGLNLLVHYNDGFVAYLNGVEVARRNTPAGDLSWNAKSLSARDKTAALFAEEINLISAMAQLNIGENVLAIHGLNNASSDADFLINPAIQVDLIASPFFTFLERYGLEMNPDALQGADMDGDGNTNLVEHALDTDPTVANGDLYPLEAGVSLNGALKITLPLNAPEDVDYYVERAVEGVENWETVASKRGSGPWTGKSIFVFVEKTVGGRVTYSLRELNITPAPGSVRLYRLGYRLRGPGS